MPDERRHRGSHPEDKNLFAESQWPALRSALGDLSWLLSRNYALKSALKVVGDRYSLCHRQRLAIMRCAASDGDVAARQSRRIEPETLEGQSIWVDGFNVLTTVEAALAGGIILEGYDGCWRDLASMHGTYRSVEETIDALGLIGKYLQESRISGCRWYLDSPVSNSGRLKAMIKDVADKQGWPWEVFLVASPDGVLVRTQAIVATSDSEILNRCGPWMDLAQTAIKAWAGSVWLVSLGRG